PLHEKAFQLLKETLGPDRIETLWCMSSLAFTYYQAGRYDRAIPLCEEALRLMRAKLGPGHVDTVHSMVTLANCYQTTRKSDLAQPLYEEALKLSRAKLGPSHPKTVISMVNLARCYRSTKRLNLAVPLYEEALKLRRLKPGPDHPATLLSMWELAEAYLREGKVDLALPLLQEAAVGVEKRQFVHEKSTRILSDLISCHLFLLEYEEAESWMQKLSAIRRARGEPESKEFTMLALGLTLMSEKKFAEAEAVYRELLAIREKNSPDDWTTFSAMAVLGAALLGQNKITEAEPLLLQGYR